MAAASTVAPRLARASAALAAAIGVETTTRANALKLLWAYIKDKKLQATVPAEGGKTKSVVRADDVLAKVFGDKTEISVPEVMSVLAKNLTTLPKEAKEEPLK
jgi:chromatin remodeling complex protein RSC6